MKPLSRFLTPNSLALPFVPLGVELQTGLAILSSLGESIVEEKDKEHSFKVQLAESAMAIYTRGSNVDAVWYDDPLGRWSVGGKQKKIELHLARYGPLENWTLWNENDWMKYWRNTSTPVRMVYGIHMDVIRFNLHDA
jgi:hypothetical protein